MIKSLLALTIGPLIAGAAQGATVVYQDSFDDDGIANNSGIGGGAANRTLAGHSWSDDGELSFNTSGTNFKNSAIAYSINSWQSDGGFELTVNYFTSSIGDTAANLLSFGLIRDDVDLATVAAADSSNPFARADLGVYSIGANVTNGQANQGLNFVNGTAGTLLDASGTNQQFIANSVTPVVIRIDADGSGGVDWTYSINGVTEATGNITTFDLDDSYRFAAYGQDDSFNRYISSVSLSTVPEPSSYALLAGLLGLSYVMIRRRQA